MNNLRKIRKAKEMTQQQLAEKVGIKRESISNVESGKNNFCLPNAQKIANALGVTLDELLER